MHSGVRRRPHLAFSRRGRATTSSGSISIIASVSGWRQSEQAFRRISPPPLRHGLIKQSDTLWRFHFHPWNSFARRLKDVELEEKSVFVWFLVPFFFLISLFFLRRRGGCLFCVPPPPLCFCASLSCLSLLGVLCVVAVVTVFFCACFAFSFPLASSLFISREVFGWFPSPTWFLHHPVIPPPPPPPPHTSKKHTRKRTRTSTHFASQTDTQKDVRAFTRFP